MFISHSRGQDPIWLGRVQALYILPLLYEFMGVSVLVCPQDLLPRCHPSSLALAVFPPPFPHRALSSEERRLKTSNSGLGAPRTLTLSNGLPTASLWHICWLSFLMLLAFLSSSQDQNLQSHAFAFFIWLRIFHKYYSACNLTSIFLVLNLHKGA